MCLIKKEIKKIENKTLLEKLIEFCKENKLNILKFEVNDDNTYDIKLIENVIKNSHIGFNNLCYLSI